MTAEFPIATVPVASSVISPGPEGGGAFFDIRQTVLSQYANSPVLLALIDSFSEWLDPNARFDAFFDQIWNIDTADGYGLDVWGHILGVGRVLQVPTDAFIGFQQQAEAHPFGHGILFRGTRATANATLTDEAYRTLLLAKAALNITDASTPAINQILLNLFGDGYVRDNLDMTITYVFSAPLDPVETSIVLNSGVLPKPGGVSASVETP